MRIAPLSLLALVACSPDHPSRDPVDVPPSDAGIDAPDRDAAPDADGPRVFPLEIDIKLSVTGTLGHANVFAQDPAHPCSYSGHMMPLASGCYQVGGGGGGPDCEPLRCLDVVVEQAGHVYHPTPSGPGCRTEWWAPLTHTSAVTVHLTGCGASSDVTIGWGGFPADIQLGEIHADLATSTLVLPWTEPFANAAAAEWSQEGDDTSTVCAAEGDQILLPFPDAGGHVEACSYNRSEPIVIPHGTLRVWKESLGGFHYGVVVPTPVASMPGRFGVATGEAIDAETPAGPEQLEGLSITFDPTVSPLDEALGLTAQSDTHRLTYLAAGGTDTLTWRALATNEVCTGLTPHVTPSSPFQLGHAGPHPFAMTTPTVALGCDGGGALDLSFSLDFQWDFTVAWPD